MMPLASDNGCTYAFRMLPLALIVRASGQRAAAIGLVMENLQTLGRRDFLWEILLFFVGMSHRAWPCSRDMGDLYLKQAKPIKGRASLTQ
jgi:hypothetical protein